MPGLSVVHHLLFKELQMVLVVPVNLQESDGDLAVPPALMYFAPASLHEQNNNFSQKEKRKATTYVLLMCISDSLPCLWVLRGPAAQRGCPTPEGRRWSDSPCGRWGPSTGSPENWADRPTRRHPAPRRSPRSSWSPPRRPHPLPHPHSPHRPPHSPPLPLDLHLRPRFPPPLPTRVCWCLCY